MREFLGLSTQGNYRDGVMQDVHWPSGAFGYFPAYSLGAMVGAQLFASAVGQHPEIKQQLTQANFTTLLQWLRTHVHQKASSRDFNTLLIEATGQPLNASFYLEHVKRRYG